MISDVLRDVLASNAGIVAALATYEFTTGAPEVAIFTTERIPDDVNRFPVILIVDLSGTPWGTRCKRGAEAFARVMVYGDKNWTLDVIRDIAWDVNRAIDRVALDSRLAPYGYSAALCQADPPGYLTDPDGFPGYAIDVRTKILRA